MSEDKNLKAQIINATLQTLRLLERTEVDSPELKNSYTEVIFHLQYVVLPKFQEM